MNNIGLFKIETPREREAGAQEKAIQEVTKVTDKMVDAFADYKHDVEQAQQNFIHNLQTKSAEIRQRIHTKKAQ
jgi:hypothetical protein